MPDMILKTPHVISFKSQKYLLRIKIFLSEVLLYISSKLSALQTYHKNPNKRGCIISILIMKKQRIRKLEATNLQE